jgi:tRNA dimethylallyltransferase
VKGVALLGPTSSGKTGVSLELAARLRAQGRRPVVLNADSRQVYRYMDIGTSKIAPRDMQGIEHRLLDLVEPTGPLPLERYAAEARRALDDLLTEPDALPIVVGGTGTYVRAIVDAWDLAGTATTRRDLEREFPRGEVSEAHRMLKRIDPEAAARVSARSYEGTLNALVRAMHPDGGGGGGKSGASDASGYEWIVVAVDRKPAALERRVAATLDRQLQSGLFDEVRALDERYALAAEFARRGPAASNQVLHTHGYREFFEQARSQGRPVAQLTTTDLAAVRDAALEHIVAYTRRQRAWFKKIDHVRPPSGQDSCEWIANRLRA